MTIMGHLGSDPEVRFTSSGQKVTTLRVAANQRRGGKDETFWWRVTIWGESQDKIISYLKKGSAVVVYGEMLKPEIYTDKENQPQVSLNLTCHHVTFPPFGKSDRVENDNRYQQPNQSSEQAYQGAANAGTGQMQGQSSAPSSANPFSEDEIPF